jgi:predicted esterase
LEPETPGDRGGVAQTSETSSPAPSGGAGETAAAADDPGPPPGACVFDKGELFERDSGKSKYVVYVPPSYDGSPTRLLVGLHGCGDTAQNFAEWAVNPYATRAGQKHIGISIDGASGGGNCWSVGNDAPKVLAAIDDVAKCVYVHRKKITVGGFSSGGILAYSVGLSHASRFAGILVENSALSSTGEAGDLIAKASWNLNLAHLARTADSVFPISKVRNDWATLKASGFPTETRELPGGHDGDTESWAGWLIPRMESWQSP